MFEERIKGKKVKVNKFKEFVEKKIQSILNKKIPVPRKLNKELVEEQTTKLAFNEMKKFKKEHERLPTKQELDKIAETIYFQIKKEAEKNEKKSRGKRKTVLEERKKRREHREGEEKETNKQSFAEKRRKRRDIFEKKESEKMEVKEEIPEIGEKPDISLKEAKELSVSDLLSDENLENLNTKDLFENENFGNLEKELSVIGNDSESVTTEIKTDKSKCPNCKTFTEDLVFCPECGVAFCSHCAKKVENLEEYIKFTCPKCKTTFKSKKN